MTNSFLTIYKGKDLIPAIIDQLSLNLQDLKVSRYDDLFVGSYTVKLLIIIFRVKLNDDVKSLIFDCLLLQPITFSLIVKRNLSSGWYTECPDFDIVAKFDSIKV